MRCASTGSGQFGQMDHLTAAEEAALVSLRSKAQRDNLYCRCRHESFGPGPIKGLTCLIDTIKLELFRVELSKPRFPQYHCVQAACPAFSKSMSLSNHVDQKMSSYLFWAGDVHTHRENVLRIPTPSLRL